MDADELIIRECVRDTIARYNHAGDSGRYDDMIACFTPDGVLSIVGGDEYEGHDALRGFFSGVGAARPTLTMLRHGVTNTLIEVEPTAELARANSYFFVITDIGVDHWGRYRDRFELVLDTDGEDRWLLAHRSVKTDGYAPDSLFR